MSPMSDAPRDPPTHEPPAKPTLGEASRVWAKIGLLSFGGPAGQIALMHSELVERRRWIGEQRFLHALNYCMLLPGPEAMQLATYVGWLLHGTLGGLIAGFFFVLPGFLAILGLSILYVTVRDAPLAAAVFFGIKAAVLAVVVEAVLRVGKRALRSRFMVGIAAAAFVAIFFFSVPFPAIVAAAALLGLLGSRVFPGAFPRGEAANTVSGRGPLIDELFERGELAHTRATLGKTLRTLFVWLLLWFAPLGLLALIVGGSSVFVQEGLFFSEAAVVTFGGAYSVLAYIAQRAVETYGWLRPGEMLDGLGLAETTPGPLIMVVQFVAFLGASRNPGGLDPIAAGVLGSVVTVWVTFVPCFLWIFVGAPYIELLRGNERLRAALSAITAAVVGVILNLSLWFALHTLFAKVHEVDAGPVRLLVPEWATIDVAALVLAAAAMLAMLRFHVGMGKTLLASALLGVAWFYLGPA